MTPPDGFTYSLALCVALAAAVAAAGGLSGARSALDTLLSRTPPPNLVPPIGDVTVKTYSVDNATLLVLDNVRVEGMEAFLQAGNFDNRPKEAYLHTAFPGPTAAVPAALIEDFLRIAGPAIREHFPAEFWGDIASVESVGDGAADGFASVLCADGRARYCHHL